MASDKRSSAYENDLELQPLAFLDCMLLIRMRRKQTRPHLRSDHNTKHHCGCNWMDQASVLFILPNQPLFRWQKKHSLAEMRNQHHQNIEAIIQTSVAEHNGWHDNRWTTWWCRPCLHGSECGVSRIKLDPTVWCTLTLKLNCCKLGKGVVTEELPIPDEGLSTKHFFLTVFLDYNPPSPALPVCIRLLTFLPLLVLVTLQRVLKIATYCVVQPPQECVKLTVY